jgi:hypothetical protein
MSYPQYPGQQYPAGQNPGQNPAQYTPASYQPQPSNGQGYQPPSYGQQPQPVQPQQQPQPVQPQQQPVQQSGYPQQGYAQPQQGGYPQQGYQQQSYQQPQQGGYQQPGNYPQAGSYPGQQPGYGASPYGQNAYGGYNPSYGMGRAPQDGGENVLMGSLLSLAIIPAAFVVCMLIGMTGKVVFYSGTLIPLGAAFLYQVGAGRSPKKGLPAWLGVTILGGLAGFYGIIAGALSEGYSKLVEVYGDDLTEEKSRFGFIFENFLKPEAFKGLVTENKFSTIMFAVFVAAGIALVILKRLPWMKND